MTARPPPLQTAPRSQLAAQWHRNKKIAPPAARNLCSVHSSLKSWGMMRQSIHGETCKTCTFRALVSTQSSSPKTRLERGSCEPDAHSNIDKCGSNHDDGRDALQSNVQSSPHIPLSLITHTHTHKHTHTQTHTQTHTHTHTHRHRCVQ